MSQEAPSLRARLSAISSRLQALMEEYGGIALAVWMVLFIGTMAASYTAIKLGFQVETAAGSASTFAAAYAFTMLTKPARAVATLALTPVVARLASRRQTPPAADPAQAPEDAPRS
ncbi:FAM210 family protein [Myxococcota bacterium]|nr:FAM210 family protein [Myxococcota bacterium]